MTDDREVQRDREALRAEVIDGLYECLGEVIGVEEVALLGITEETKVFLDLGLSSIDVAKLAELVDERYPIADKLQPWLADMRVSAIARLTVGDFVDFITDAIS